ncbi:MAG: UDP-N-acetylmuramoyl-L-alanine--D-glutamate ligase [Oscillospiraceae bacterium]|nr:UDP-N-acetylmuramoyl-L-alanine--D-glutamate ligase [Oscillospiraceae bacterium]
MDFKGKKVILLGAGRSNAAVMKYAHGLGADIELREYDKTRVTGEFLKYCTSIKTGEKYTEKLDCDILVKTPVIRADIPEIVDAQKNGAVLTSDVRLFFAGTKARIIGITGSSGKSTTTALIYEMLKKSGKKAYIGGNTGVPLMNYINLPPDAFVAAELSSFQLSDAEKSPHTAVVTNIYPNHLDVHKSMEEYIGAKKNIMCTCPQKAVLNYDDEIVRGFCGAKKTVYFSTRSSDADVFFRGGYIYAGGEKFFDTSKIKIPGDFNIKNYMAAAAAVMDICGKNAMIAAAEEFRGVPHRNMFIGCVNGVNYFDSSIDSSPDRTAATLSAYDKKVILLAGGRGKGVPYDSLEEPFRSKVKLLITTGENAAEINRVAEKSGIRYMSAANYAEAAAYAARAAAEGDTVLLSPASTAFDAFRDFEERAEFFKRCVMRI